MDQYNTSQTGSVHLSCGVSLQRQSGSTGPRGAEPKQDADDDTWFPFMNETQVGTEERVGGGVGDEEEEGWWGGQY